MVALRSKVPAILTAKGWDKQTFQAYCRLKGLSFFTADRLYAGETDFQTSTWAKVADVLGVTSLAELVDIVPDPATGESLGR